MARLVIGWSLFLALGGCLVLAVAGGVQLPGGPATMPAADSALSAP